MNALEELYYLMTGENLRPIKLICETCCAQVVQLTRIWKPLAQRYDYICRDCHERFRSRSGQ